MHPVGDFTVFVGKSTKNNAKSCLGVPLHYAKLNKIPGTALNQTQIYNWFGRSGLLRPNFIFSIAITNEWNCFKVVVNISRFYSNRNTQNGGRNATTHPVTNRSTIKNFKIHTTILDDKSHIWQKPKIPLFCNQKIFTIFQKNW
jgi:hypothetical protein